MKKTKINIENNPDPYKDMLKLEKLDPYEALIKSDLVLIAPKKNIE